MLSSITFPRNVGVASAGLGAWPQVQGYWGLWPHKQAGPGKGMGGASVELRQASLQGA